MISNGDTDFMGSPRDCVSSLVLRAGLLSSIAAHESDPTLRTMIGAIVKQMAALAKTFRSGRGQYAPRR
jgi:cytochrome c biogenesis factor